MTFVPAIADQRFVLDHVVVLDEIARHERFASLASRPPIAVPAISLFGADDGVSPPPSDLHESQAAHFTGPHEERLVAGAGHDLPQETPDAFVRAVLDVRRL